MYSICVSLPPKAPSEKHLLSTFLLAYFPSSLFLPSWLAFHSRNYGNGTAVITAVGEG